MHCSTFECLPLGTGAADLFFSLPLPSHPMSPLPPSLPPSPLFPSQGSLFTQGTKTRKRRESAAGGGKGKKEKKGKGRKRQKSNFQPLFLLPLSSLPPVVSKRCRLSPPRYYTIPRPLQEYRNRTKKTLPEREGCASVFLDRRRSAATVSPFRQFHFLDVRTLLSFPSSPVTKWRLRRIERRGFIIESGESRPSLLPFHSSSKTPPPPLPSKQGSLSIRRF